MVVERWILESWFGNASNSPEDVVREDGQVTDEEEDDDADKHARHLASRNNVAIREEVFVVVV